MSDVNPAALSKSELMAHWFQRVWTDGDATAIHEMLAPDAVVRGLGNTDAVGPESFEFLQKSLLAQVTNVRFTILRTLEDEDWLAALWKMQGQRKSDGAPVETTGTVFVQVKDGKFVTGFDHFDAIGLFQDIGILPKDTVPRLFQGQALV